MNNFKIFIIFFLCSCGQIKTNDLNHSDEATNDSFTYISIKDFDNSILEKIINADDSYKISIGSYAGQCIENCKINSVISSKGIITEKTSWDSISFPKKTIIIPPEKYNYDSILTLFDFNVFLKINEPNSEHDISDKGFFWLKISDKKESRKIFYDPTKEPKEMKELINYLNSII